MANASSVVAASGGKGVIAVDVSSNGCVRQRPHGLQLRGQRRSVPQLHLSIIKHSLTKCGLAGVIPALLLSE